MQLHGNYLVMKKINYMLEIDILRKSWGVLYRITPHTTRTPKIIRTPSPSPFPICKIQCPVYNTQAELGSGNLDPSTVTRIDSDN